MNNKQFKILIITGIGLMVLIIIFSLYWVTIRPSQIKKDCSIVVEQTKQYTIDEINLAKKDIDKDNRCNSSNSSNKYIPISCKIANTDFNNQPKEYIRSANDSEYTQCLRENGL